MSAALRERSTVSLSGEAAAEVFGGYPEVAPQPPGAVRTG
ncbi:asparagine synthase-related protein [Streptomyces sp. NPDC007907]